MNFAPNMVLKSFNVKPIEKIGFTLLVFILSILGMEGANRYSVATGNWNSTSVWSASSGGASGASFPVAGDVVYIERGYTVTVNVAAVCASISFTNTTSSSSTLSILGINTLTVSGLITMIRPTSGFVHTINVGAGSLTAGSLTMGATTSTRKNVISISTGTVTINGTVTTGTTGCQFIFTGAGLLKFGGSYSGGPAALTPSTGTVEYSSASPVIQAFSGSYYNLTFSGTGTTTGSSSGTATIQGNLANTGGGVLNFTSRPVVFSGTAAANNIAGFTTTGTVSMTKTSGTATFTGNVNGGGITINGSGGTLNLGLGLTHTFTGSWTRTNGTLNSGSSILRIGGSVSGSSGTFTAGTGTVEWYLTGNQTVAGVVYNNLTLSGSSTKTLTGVATINGNLTISGTATATTAVAMAVGGNLNIGTGTSLTVGAFNFSVVGTTNISGTHAFSSATGTKTYTNNVTINNGGLWSETAAAIINFGGNLQNDGTLTASTGVHTFTGAAKTLSGINSITIPKVTVTGSYTNNGILTVGTSLLGAGTLSQGINGTLNIGGTSTITNLNATASGNTINYNGTAQTVRSIGYYHLILSGSGTVTLPGSALTIAGNLTISGTVSATALAAINTAGNVTLGTGTTLNAGSFSHTLGGNWSKNGATFNASNSSYIFNGGSNQNIGGTASTIFNTITVSNSFGITLGNAVSATGVTLTNGLVTTTATYLLTVTGTSPTSITGSAASYINGPLARTLQANLANGSYSFPVGKTGYNPFELVNANTTSGGTVVVKAEVMDADCGGTAGVGMSLLNTNRYWNSSISQGSGNFTSAKVQLTESGIDDENAIGQSATLAGTYNSIGNNIPVGNLITSDPVPTLGYFVIGKKPILTIAANNDGKEGVSNGLFTITTTRQFTTAQTVNIAIAGTAINGTDYTLINSTVTFPALQNTVTIPVTVTNDLLVEPTETVIVTLGSGTGYAVGAADNATVNILDNDIVGITVTPTSGLATTEAGGQANFTIFLTSQPAANVTIGISSNNLLEGTVSPSSLLFTSGNWNIAQTVTISGVNDFVQDGNISYSIVTAPATSADLVYKNFDASDVSVTNMDNDVAGITVNPTSGLTTTELGGTATFNIVLNSEPTADVTIGLSSDNTTEGAVSPASLLFTSGNWNTAQTVTVAGQDDPMVDGNISYHIVTAAAISSDGLYNGKDPSDVSLSNTDNDVAGVIVTPMSGLVTSETGTTASFIIALSSKPSANVTIAISSDNTNEGTVSPSSVTFTGADWNTSRTITITGVDDHVDDGNVVYHINTGAAVSGDSNYSGKFPTVITVTNNDNDTKGISISPTLLTTTEAAGTGHTKTFTVVLNTQPTVPTVTIGLSSGNTDEGTVSTSLLTFTDLNWNTPQTVTVTGVDDFVDDGDQVYSIITAPANGGDYTGVVAADVSVTNIDDDAVGIIVSPTSGLTTTEVGGTATFTVKLNSKPTANVIIGISSGDTSEGTVSSPSLTFTTDNWNSTQTITVTGANDDIDDGNITYYVLTAAATGGDYAGINAADVAVTNTDDDVSGVTVNPTSGLITTEAGGTATFTVKLNSEPTSNVIIGITSNDTGEGTVSAATLTFLPSNWSTAQTITVTGIDDFMVDGNVGYTILTVMNPGLDLIYNAINPSDVSVTNNDNDVVGITVSPVSGLATTEALGAGHTATFTVKLNSQPSADVTIGISSNDVTEGTVSPASLKFTNTNWNTVQTVTVTGVDDFVKDGNITYSIITAAATSTDANYNNLNPSDVSLSNTDNDMAGITVNPTSGLTTTEAGGTSSFSIVLTSEPTAYVTIGISSSKPLEGTVSTSSVIFTAGNWNTAQTITITGVADHAIDGNIPYNIITAAASSGDSNYNNLNPSDVSVTNTNSDVAGITVTPTNGLFTAEDGSPDNFTIVMNTIPTTNVTIDLTSNDLTEGTVSPSSVTFAPATWNIPQTVTVTGVDDRVDDGDIVYNIVTSNASSIDPNYNGFVVSDVSVTNNDNDLAGITVNPTSGLVTSENLTTDAFTIVLNSQPLADVKINLSSDDTTEGTVSPSSITFTPINWNVVQTVTVTGVNDYQADGDIPFNIVTSQAISTDAKYNVINPDDISLTNLDNDVAGITISLNSGLVTNEAGGPASFTVLLTSQPTDNVTLGLSSNNIAEGTVSTSLLTFTSSNWSTPQTVTITGVNDALVDGDIAYLVLIVPAVSNDLDYDGFDPGDVSVTNLDRTPTISSFTPTTVCYGTGVSIVITGTFFTGTTSVRFNGVSSSYVVDNATQITATLPTAATTGTISVTTPTGNSVSGTSLTVNPVSVGGTVAGSASVCSGTNSTTLTLSGNTGTVSKWQSSSVSNFGTGVSDIANATNSLTVTNLTSTTYYRAVVASGICSSANSSVGAVTVNPLPTANAGSPLNPICQGGISGTLGGSVGGSATGGTWSSSAGGIFNPNATTLNAIWTPPANYSGTATLTLTTSGGTCSTTTASKNIVVNPTLLASVSISASATTICSGTSVTFTATPTNGGAAPTYQWRLNGSNVGTSITTYTNAAMANNDVVTCVMTSNAAPCSPGSPATSNGVTMTVSVAGTWVGTTSTNWNTASNWCGGIPTASTNVVISSGGNQPEIGANSFCNNLTINSGATLIINGSNTLTVSGNWINNGTFTANTGTVIINNAAQTVGTGPFYNLTLGGSGIKTITGTTVTGTLSMEGTATVSAAPTYGATATLQYNTLTARTVGFEWISPFVSTGGIIVANTGIITMNSAKVLGLAVPLTINSGATLNTSASNNYSMSFGGDFRNSGSFRANASPVILTGTAPTQSIDGFTTTGMVSMTKTGGTATLQGNVNSAGLTINGSGGTLNMGSVLSHSFSGNITLTAGTLYGGSSIIHVNSASTTAWNGTGTVFSAGTGTVDFGAAGNQTISASSTSFYNLNISNIGATANNSVTLGAPNSVTGSLNLSSGLLATTTTNLLSVTNSATTAISGGSASSYINGPVKWTLPASLGVGSAYIFPIGKSTTYMPFSLFNPTTGTGTVTAQVEAFMANSGGTVDAVTLASKSTDEYWSLVTTGNFTNSSVSLSRPTTIAPFDAIGGSSSIIGTYTSLAGTPEVSGVASSNVIAANRFFLLAEQKKSITTVTITDGPFCSGAVGVSVPFTYTPKTTFAGATFTAQLSNASGSFSSPVVLQSVASNGSGSQSLNVTIPLGTTSGTGYHIRIVSTNPVATGSDNDAVIVISAAVPMQPGPITGNSTPCSNTAGITYSVPNVSGVTYTWTFPIGWTQTAGGTSNSVTVTSGYSSGTIQVVPSNSCGDGVPQILGVSVIATTIIVQPSTVAQSVCQNGTTSSLSVTASGTGLYYQWYSNSVSSNIGGTLLSGANLSNYTPSSNVIGNLYYFCVITGDCSPTVSSEVSGPVTVVIPQALTGNPASRCGQGTVALSVTPSSCINPTIDWFTAATGGTSLKTGANYTTPSISSTTAYYAQETITGGLATIGSSSINSNDFGLVFDLSEQIVLNSVQVKASSSGSITIGLRNNVGGIVSGVSDVSISVNGTQTVILNWTIPAGTGYRILKTVGSTISLARTDPYSSWPIGFDVGSITSSIEGGTTNTARYNFFYNWSISRMRVAVTATIGAPIVTGYHGSSCGPGMVEVGASATSGTISWFSALTGGTALSTGTIYSPNINTTTTYYVQSTDGACTSSPRIPVIASVINKPTILAGGFGAYCGGSTINLTSTGTSQTNRYWTGPNNFYSLLDNPVLTNATPAMTGIYTVIGSALSGVNLVTNGDFELGNLGFGSSYIYAAPVANALWTEGLYTVVASPRSVHDNFATCSDYTSGAGTKQMVVNGATVANVNIWSQTVKVVPNTDYQYTYWIQSVVAENPARLQLYINGSPAGPIYTADTPTCSWKQFTYNWNSGASTSAYLSLVNQNIVAGGNDFALDDIVFQPACTTESPIPVFPDPNGAGGEYADKGVIYVTVAAVPTAGAIGTAQTICSGATPSTLTSTTFGTGSGSVTYQWQANSGSGYSVIASATSATYSPPPLTSTTSYQRRTVSNNKGIYCYSAYTSAVTVTVNSTVTANAGGPDSEICQSGSPSPITLSGASVGGSATTGAWSVVAGGGSLSDYSQTSTPALVTYTPSANYNGTVTLRLTSNTVGCTALANRVITIRPTPTVSINGTTTICQNGTSPIITFTNPQTLLVTVTYNINGSNQTTINVGASTTATLSVSTASTGVFAYNLVNVGYQSGTTCSNAVSGTATVTINTTVGTPVFNLGSTSRCLGAGQVTYTATATNNTGIAYTLDAGSITGGNSIVASTGVVSYVAGWTGTSTITASATGCNGPKVAAYTVTTTPVVGTPSIPTPSNITICQGSGTTDFSTSSTNATSYNWSVTGSGNTISGTGTTALVTWAAGFSGTATISVTANGCNGPSASASSGVTVRPTPTASISGTTTVCQNTSPPNIVFTNPQNLPITITYNVNGANQTTVNVGANGTSNVAVPTSTVGEFAYNLVSAVYQTAPSCSNAVTGSANITISALPSATISYPNSPYCKSLLTAQSVTRTGTTGGTYSALPAGLTINTNTGAITPNTSLAGTYIVTYTVAASGGCGIYSTNTSLTIISDLVWTGSVNADWNNAENWYCNLIPDLTTDVLIPNVANQPILSNGANGKSKNIVINTGSSLTVSGNKLQIAGTISNSGTFTASAGTIEMKGFANQIIPANSFVGNTIMNLNIDNNSGVTLQGPLNISGIVDAINGNLSTGGYLTLVSTAAQTALIDGSGTGEVLGNVTMQRFLPTAFGYKYFSSPFRDATVAQFADDINLAASFPTFYKYDEYHLSTTGTDMTGWTAYTAQTGMLNSLEGYAANFGPAATVKTVDITGVVNNGSIQRTLSNHNRTYTKGFNLIGNPYPSPINWDNAGWTKTNVDNSIYFFNASSPSVNSDLNDSIQYKGTYSSYVGGVSTGINDNNIAAMQGFFVHVTNGVYPVNATLGVTNAVRINNINPIFKEVKFDGRVILRFSARFDISNPCSDAAVIYFDDQAKQSFDTNKDALKITNTDEQVPNLFSLSTDLRQLSINGMNSPTDSLTKIPLGIKTLSDGWINFSADDISQLPEGMQIYLLDSQSSVVQDLQQRPEYRFYLKTGEYNQRFTIVFSKSDLSKVRDTRRKMFTLLRSSDNISIKVALPFNVGGNLLVTNMKGQVLLQKNVFEIESVELNSNLSSGVYVITLISDNKTESEKILMRKDYE